MDARATAQEALAYVCILESLTKGYDALGGFLEGGNVAIEGARLIDGIWQISVGFDRPWDRHARPGLSMLLVADGGNRTVKTVSIDDASREVLDYEPL